MLIWILVDGSNGQIPSTPDKKIPLPAKFPILPHPLKLVEKP